MCPSGVEAGQGGADGDGLLGADLAGDHTEGTLADAPADTSTVYAGAGDRHRYGKQRHRHTEFLTFLKQVARAYP